MAETRTIFDEFLEYTTRAGQELAARSDVLELERLPVRCEGLFLARYAVSFLVRSEDGRIAVAPGPLPVLIRMSPAYLATVNPLEIAQIPERMFWHPNYRWPVLCLGEVRPGMMLPTLIRHVFEIVTYQNFATDDGLNGEACYRLRNEPGLLAMLPRAPRLVRRSLEVSRAEVHGAGPGEESS
jgi:hypothetical protein